jgi:hypothetical protein
LLHCLSRCRWRPYVSTATTHGRNLSSRVVY